MKNIFNYAAISLSLLGVVSAEISQPNILFIFADDWGWADLSCHGHAYIKTPNIDRLAKEGADFQNFTVASGVCSPSRVAVLTGMFPARFAVNGHFGKVSSNLKRGMPDWFDPTQPMLPKMLQEAGYITGHFGKWHLTNTGINDAPSPKEYGYDKAETYNSPGEQMPVHDDAKNAITLIEESQQAGKPFFINLWIHEPHTPFHTVKKYEERFPDLEKADNIYASVISHADDRIGEVLDALDRLKLTEQTLVIFSSDNGPEKTGKNTFRQKYDPATGRGYDTVASVGTTGGRKERKRSNFQGGIGVPFIARWPGQIESGRIDNISWISAVDLLPTFCELAGAELPEDYEPDGISQVKVLKGVVAELREKPLFWKSTTASNRGQGKIGEYAMIAGKWKLLTNNDSSKSELYDVTIDPLEKKDLSEHHPEVLLELVKKLEKWKSTLPKKYDTKLISKSRNKSNG